MIGKMSEYKGSEIAIYGWVKVRRDQGKLIFFDFLDASGLVQGVILPGSEAMEVGKETREGFVVKVEGQVNERPERNRNMEVVNGDIELEIKRMEIINSSEVAPFPYNDEDTRLINEEVRLKYRYLDLRNARMQKNLRNKAKIQSLVRAELEKDGFVEVETPLLSAPTPEGARSFIVPSRLWQGGFYSLPQSPQQYKQLLMVAGLERYFQFARCIRDEDTRGDRQPEFTQFDLEMSFVDQEEVMSLNEKLLIKVVEKIYPEKRIQQVPFPRMTYAEAMEKYGSDRPDIREDKNDKDLLAFLWITDFPLMEKTGEVNLDQTGEWTFTHNPFTRPKDEDLDKFMDGVSLESVLSYQYDITLNGYEIGGGSVRNHLPEIQRRVFEIMGYSDERIDKSFGHMIEALSFGAPPHGGIAWGMDRLLMLLENEPNIREVIAFAKTGDGKDLMMGAPSLVSQSQLDELGIEIK